MERAGGVTTSALAKTAINLPRDLLDRLNDEARIRCVGRSRLVAAAVNEWLERHGETE